MGSILLSSAVSIVGIVTRESTKGGLNASQAGKESDPRGSSLAGSGTYVRKKCLSRAVSRQRQKHHAINYEDSLDTMQLIPGCQVFMSRRSLM